LSTLATQPETLPDWKQEVNRRLAEHQSRRDSNPPQPPAELKSHLAANSRGARAVARVAARYAHAPSFNELQTGEARAALRAAETATRAALEAQAVARLALDQLDAGAGFKTSENGPDLVVSQTIFEVPPSSAQFALEAQPQTREMDFATGRPYSPPALSESEGGWQWEELSLEHREIPAGQAADTLDPSEPIHANLIQFPRELVATRRLRSNAEGTHSDATGQLSIFEVDPAAVSTTPGTPDVPAEGDSLWAGPEWSRIELDAQPAFEHAGNLEESGQRFRIEHAPWSLRLMSSLVDVALIVGTVSVFVAAVARYMHPALSVRTSESLAVLTMVAASAAYHWFFLLKWQGTPGMRYAGISLCTFEDERPSRAQLRSRFYATLVSVLPIGLGFVWAIFDDDCLSWHDRLSRTYQRRF
jgi:uncharacterized RDD family membrane protein YckC